MSAAVATAIDAEPSVERSVDGAVVPLLYEGRLVKQQVSGNVIDRWFDKISEGLTGSQKADLKRKFSRMDALAETDQAIRAKAFDISEHYRQHWQGTGFKAQLVAPSKAAAVRFKEWCYPRLTGHLGEFLGADELSRRAHPEP